MHDSTGEHVAAAQFPELFDPTTVPICAWRAVWLEIHFALTYFGANLR
jgi:hypothetical protein